MHSEVTSIPFQVTREFVVCTSQGFPPKLPPLSLAAVNHNKWPQRPGRRQFCSSPFRKEDQDIKPPN